MQLHLCGIHTNIPGPGLNVFVHGDIPNNDISFAYPCGNVSQKGRKVFLLRFPIKLIQIENGLNRLFLHTASIA